MKPGMMFLGVAALAVASPAAAQNQFGPGLRSVKMAVDDFPKAIAFYTALGMKAGTNRGTTQDLEWEGKSQNSGITMAAPSYPGRKDLVRGGVFLMVVTPDVKGVADRLRKAGFPVAGEPRQMGTMATVLMLTDPDGNRIELLGPAAPPAK